MMLKKYFWRMANSRRHKQEPQTSQTGRTCLNQVIKRCCWLKTNMSLLKSEFLVSFANTWLLKRVKLKFDLKLSTT